MDVHIRIAVIPLFFKRFSQYDEGSMNYNLITV